VLQLIPANKRKSFFRLLLLSGILFFTSPDVYAQYDSTEAEKDINQYVDEEAGSTTGQDDKKDSYFINKSEYDSLLFMHRTVPDSVLLKMLGEKAFWYANRENTKGKRTTQPIREVKNGKKVVQEVPYKEETDPPYVPITRQSWFQTLMWVMIVGGFAGAIIWYLAGSNVGLFRKKIRKMDDEVTEEMPEDIFAINYQKEIDKAAATGNYRLAIRLMYLRLLKDLSEKNIIQYKQDRTNLDYMMQLHPTTYYNDFFLVTRHYEYSWYGEFNVSSDAYTIIKKEFDQFEKITG
jgi:hypothetical protein